MRAISYRPLSRPVVFANLWYPTQNCHGQRKGMWQNHFRQKRSQIVFKRECTSFLRLAVSRIDDKGHCPSAPCLKGVVRTNEESISLDQRLWLIFEQSCIVLGAVCFLCPVALADSGNGVVNYNPEQSSETLKNIAGAGYILLVIFYFVRLFKKRAARAVEVKLSSRESTDTEKMKDALDRLDDDVNEEETGAAEAEVTPLQCFIGVAQAGTICYLLYLVSTAVDDYFARQSVPDQYTARNITLLIQSVVRGLVYLAVGIFGANATGLAALGIQLIVNPDGVDKTFNVGKAASPKEKLPSVKVTDNIADIKRAFREAENMGKRENSK